MLVILNESDDEDSGKEKKDYKSNESDFLTRIGCELEDFGDRHVGAREQYEEKEGKHRIIDLSTMVVLHRLSWFCCGLNAGFGCSIWRLFTRSR